MMNRRRNPYDAAIGQTTLSWLTDAGVFSPAASSPYGVDGAITQAALETLAGQVKTLIEEKGFSVGGVTGMDDGFEFYVYLYEGSEAHDYDVALVLSPSGKVKLRFQGDFKGIYSKITPSLPEEIASSVLAALRLKMATLSLTKLPPSAEPKAAGAATPKPASTPTPVPASSVKKPALLPGGMKYLPNDYNFADLDDATSSSNGALIWFGQEDGAHSVWYHFGTDEWAKILNDGDGSGTVLDEEEFEALAKKSNYIVLMGYSYNASPNRKALIDKMLAVMPTASPVVAPTVSTPEPGDAVDPSIVADIGTMPSASIIAICNNANVGPTLLYKQKPDVFYGVYNSGAIQGSPHDTAKTQSAISSYNATWVVWVAYDNAETHTEKGRKALFLAAAAKLPDFDTWKGQLPEADLKKALKSAAAKPKKAAVPKLPKINVSKLKKYAAAGSPSALIVLQGANGEKSAWHHWAQDDWTQIDVDNGFSLATVLTEGAMQNMVDSAVWAILADAAVPWGSDSRLSAIQGALAKLTVPAPSKAKGAKASAVVEEPTYASAVAIPESEKAKAKKITSIAANLSTLGPLIKEAAAKVPNVITEAGAGGINMTLKPELSSSVTLADATANAVTLVYYKDSMAAGEKQITLPVPDAAGSLASAIANAMVYFLVYSDKSEGKKQVTPPSTTPTVLVVDDVALVPGANITTQAQLYALPKNSWLSAVDATGPLPLDALYAPEDANLPATIRFYAEPDWETYYKPLTESMAAAAMKGVFVPQPKGPGWPPVQVAPTLALYTSLPVGTLLRTDFSGGSVFAARVDQGGYQKVDSATGSVTQSTKRSPTTLVQDAIKTKATPFVLRVGDGTVPTAAVFKQYIEGKRADSADAEATTAASMVEMLAGVLGIDPRVAAMFSQKALEAMVAQKGIPYMGSSLIPPIPATAKSPLLKNPRITFRSNPEKYRDTVRNVLGIKNPTTRHLLDAELLDAAGLPLEGAAPHNRRRNPEGGVGSLTTEETGIVKAVADALKQALGSAAQPSGSTPVGSAMDSKLSSMYGSGGHPRPESSGSLAQYLRYLVAARALGLWKNYIDPGERTVFRGLSFTSTQANDPSQSLRVNKDGLAQIEAMKEVGFISTPVQPYEAMKAWLKRQSLGVGWTRADVDKPWEASDMLKPPANYPDKLTSLGEYNNTSTVRGWNTKQRAEGGGSWLGKLPYPAWAGEPWANVEGFCVDYHDPTFSSFTATEWGATLWGYPTQQSFCLRANTRDPRFVLLPGSKISGGPLSSFVTEAAIVFVTVDTTPLKAEVILVNGGSERLTEDQIWAWIRARPAYPTGPKPTGPAAGIAMHRNPVRRTLTLDSVHAFLFPRHKWGPGAVRRWLAEHDLEGFSVQAAGDVWRVEVYGIGSFYPGSIKRREVGNGIFVLVGKPL